MTALHRSLFGLLVAALGCGKDLQSLPNFRTASGTCVVFLGDSLTSAPGVATGARFTDRLADVLPCEVVNAGRGGDTTGEALRRFERDVTSHAPAVVVVLLGGNDALRRLPAAAAARNLSAIVARIIDIGAIPVLIDFRLGPFGAGYTDFIEEVAKRTGALHLDRVLDDVLRSPALKLDPIHPNAAGHERIAARLQEPLRELLEALEAR